MTILFILLLIIIFITFAFVTLSNKPPPLDSQLFNPYISKKPLTNTEIIFFNKLREALPEYLVLAQVQLSSFIKVDRSLINFNETYKWQNPLLQQSVDYLICKQDFSIVAAVELDDKTHNSQTAVSRDAKKEANLEAARVRLIRWHAENMPTLDEIQFEINRYQIALTEDSSGAEEWIIERNDQFFEPRTIGKKISTIKNNIIVFKILLLILATAIILIGVNVITSNTSKLFSNPVTSGIQSISDGIKNRSQENLKASIEKQEFERHKKIEERRSELQLQQQLNQRQDELRTAAIKEQTLKEDIWNSQYKEKLDCTYKNALDCGNDNIKARREFEAYWEANKSKLLNKE